MNYYEILGVSKTASYEEIKNYYKTLVKKYHPDLYQGDKTFAEKKTQEINVAYDILSDSNKRAEYDLELNPPDDINTYNYTPPKYTTSNYNYDDDSYSNNLLQKRHHIILVVTFKIITLILIITIRNIQMIFSLTN